MASLPTCAHVAEGNINQHPTVPHHSMSLSSLRQPSELQTQLICGSHTVDLDGVTNQHGSGRPSRSTYRV
ncbi:unnamed protein product [Periconia digitata]|uniref:Uncharacterized protein n=1 Tax=Periconia digitata TaxID=1303443 RepID=A0A9W4UQF7_9PLEO|nr:unnamed protein product [Periconia digitata]